MTPKRIQRKRIKGWRMPENTVYVGRGTKYGNPYTILKGSGLGFEVHDTTFEYLEDANEYAVNMYYRFLVEQLAKNPKFLEPLRGKNLACFCSLDVSCHADVLLKLANMEAQ